jgi:phage baseplate assembly protein W
VANRVFNIDYSTDDSSDESSLEVYKDISMQSDLVEGTGFISRDVNVQAVQNSIRNIFTWIVGERVLDPEFGNRLYQYLYEGLNDFNIELVIAEIRNCVSKYEPRVTITELRNVTTTDDADDNTVVIDMIYAIKGLDGQSFTYRYTAQKGK